MGTVFVAASGKGGTGKTSVVAGVSCCLAAMENSVLCIDADAGLRNLDLALGMTDLSPFDLGDVLRGEVPLSTAAAKHPEISGLHLLNSPLDTEYLPLISFQHLVKEAEEQFDYVFIDCPAGLGEMVRHASGCALRGMVVTTLDLSGIRGAGRAAELLLSCGVSDVRLIVNRVRPRFIESGDTPNVDDAMDATGLPLLGVIPEDDRVTGSLNHMSPLILSADDEAAEAYYNIACRIKGERVPVMKMRNR